jgi:hypothetical protein
MYTYFVAFDYYDHISQESKKGNSVIRSPVRIECQYDVVKIETDIEGALSRGLNVVVSNFILLFAED